MAIFRGVGGSGDSSDSSFLQAVTEQAEAAEASRLASASAANLAVNFASTASTAATTATTQANSILNLTAATGDAGTNASYNASTGVLTIPRGADGSDATVTTSNVTAAGAAMETGATFTGAVNVTGGSLSVGALGGNQNLNVVGNIVVSGTVDSVDIATRDGILTSTTATANSAMQDLIDDTTPQLGGELNAESNNIINVGHISGAQLTVGNLGFSTISDINLNSNDITNVNTVDGRDISVDGTKLDTIPYHRATYLKLRYNTLILNLNTVHQDIGQYTSIYSLATPVKCSRYLDFQTEVEWKFLSSTNNDLKFKLQFPVPTNNATVTTLGTATAGPFTGYSTGQYESWFYVSGDVTHLLTAFGRMNKTGTTNSVELIARGWQYVQGLDRTYILTDNNPAVSISTGDTVYWHPYAWEAAGTNLFIEETLSERYVGTGSRQNLSLKFKTAYDDSSIVYRAMMKEITGSDSATVRSAEVALTDVGEV